MRIVYLHQYFTTPSMPGGTRSYEMARRFAAAGHEVHVITSSTNPSNSIPRWTTEELDDVTVHWIPIKYDNGMSVPRRLVAFGTFALAAGWKARRMKPDVIFATSTPLTIALPGVFAKCKSRARMVFEVRDLWPKVPIALGALNNPLMRKVALMLEQFAYRNSDAVIALSPGMVEGVADKGVPRGKISMIPNSCDNASFDVAEEEGMAFRAERQWLGDRPLVLYAGTLGRVNGVGYFAHLAKSVCLIDPEIRFLVVGDGAERDLVANLASKLGVRDVNFFMERSVPKSSMPRLMSAATVATSLVIPVKELEANSANKFFDALAAGRPIAINHDGWQADLIRDNGLGVVLDPANMDSAASSLVGLVHDPGWLQRARESALTIARTQFDRDLLARQALTILESVYR